MTQTQVLEDLIREETSKFIPSHMELINIPEEDLHLLTAGLRKQVNHLKASYYSAIERAQAKYLNI